VDWIRHIETIQIVLDKKGLTRCRSAARRTKPNRSALVREALRENLRRLEVRAKEGRDREGCAKQPQAPDESLVLGSEAARPGHVQIRTIS
jgi:hypothetical protein